MISSDMRLYQKQIYNFLRSITIKYEPLGVLINLSLQKQGLQTDFSDKTRWKYYLNMIGEYHASDTMMQVTSLDTKQVINFTKENLNSHPRTAEAYAPGGTYYQRLCATYPKQVDLIKSILFPVSSMEKALAAKDLTLVQYGSGFLEEAEEPALIVDIQNFLSMYSERWHFDFIAAEELFDLTAIGALYGELAMLIAAKRISYIKTSYVHSFHLWNELKSHGIGDYSDILPREQAMMLYQNIGYFDDNRGKHSNLMILAKRLLKDFGIGLYGRKVIMDRQTKASDYQLKPLLAPISIPVNYSTLSSEIPTIDVDILQNYLFDQGLADATDAQTVETAEDHLVSTPFNEYPTKFLEIRPLPKNIPFVLLMSNFLLETLVVSIAEGYYRNQIRVVEPLGGNALYLTPGEALALYSYATSRIAGEKNDVIPKKALIQIAFRTALEPALKLIDTFGRKTHVAKYINVQKWFQDVYYDTDITDPADFSVMADRLWGAYVMHQLSDMSTSLGEFGEVIRYLSGLCHEKRVIEMDLIPGFDSMSTWLGSEGIDISNAIIDTYDGQADSVTAWTRLADALMIELVPPTTFMDTFGDFSLAQYGYDRIRNLFVQMCSYMVVFSDSSKNTPYTNSGNKLSNDIAKDEIFDEIDDSGYLLLRYQDTQDDVDEVSLEIPSISSVSDDIHSSVGTYHESVLTIMDVMDAGMPPERAVVSDPGTVTVNSVQTISLPIFGMHHYAP